MVQHVLIADDHPVTRDTLHATLNSEPGVRVIGVAEDGEEAVQQTFALRPDVLLLDIRMPRMSGLEAARRLRKLGYAGRIVAFSSDDDPATALACRLSGADVLVSKAQPLSTVVAALLGTWPAEEPQA